MARLAAVGAVLLVASLAACGGGGGGDEGCPAGATLAVFPPEATVIAGGAGIDFGAGLTDCQAMMSWRLTGPGSISPTQGVPITYTPPAEVAAETTATLTVSAGGLEADAVITIRPATLLLAGTVIDLNGTPVEGALVEVGAASDVTDAAGAFALDGVARPYQVVVTAPNGLLATHYDLMERSDPTLMLFEAVATIPRGGYVAGTLSGGAGFPPPALHEAGVAFAAPQAWGWGPALAAGGYDLGLAWSGPAAVTGTVHALQWQVDEGDQRPVSFDGHAVLAGVGVESGARTEGQDLLLTPVGSNAVSGTLTSRGDPAGAGVSVVVRFADGARLRIHPPPSSPSPFPYIGSSGTFSVATPELAGVTIDVAAAQSFAGGAWLQVHRTGVANGASALALDFPWPMVQEQPTYGSTWIPGQPFSWYDIPDAPVYVASFRSLSGSVSLDVVTTHRGFTIPAEMAVPVGARYTWRVQATSAFHAVDDAAGPGGFFAPAPSYVLAGTGEWDFTVGGP